MEAVQGGTRAMSSHPPATILVADADEAGRRRVAGIRQQAGFAVREAATGAEALRHAAAGADLIVLDPRLADADGSEVGRRLRADPATARIPVLHLTAGPPEGERPPGEGYLAGPAEPPELLASVQELLRLRSTEEHRRQAQALQTLSRLEAVGRLAGGVAHEFNNLLAVITGHSELLLAQPAVQGEARAALEEIKRAGARAAVLTRQLLALSRRQVLAPVVLDLNQLLAGMEELLRRAMGADVEVALQPAAGLWPVKADAAQLEQVVLNLALNARDAMPHGGRLTLETRNVAAGAAGRPESLPPGDHVALAVGDTGTGMDAATRARLFEPFFTTKEEGRGSGLGLAVVHGIVTQSGGHIDVDSRPGGGTTFTVYLPRAGEAAA